MVIGLAWAAVGGAAELRLAAVFSDHMVLQRDKPVPVWGWAVAGERVTVEFAGQSKTAVAGADGKWTVVFDTMPSAAESRVLIVRSEQPERSIRVADVLVGEVWLGAGQSNMAMGVGEAQEFDAEKAAADLPQLRMFTEKSRASESPRPDAEGVWSVCSPDTVGAFSATLYFFGRALHRELGVPVGLINSSVGGRPIESWIPADAQDAVPALREANAAAKSADARFNRAATAAAMERWQASTGTARQAGMTPPRQPQDPVAARDRKGGIGGLFNGKIAPLIPYAICGVVWYQGEANARRGRGDLYRLQLPLLVQTWRSRWGEELPFAWVQLPNFEQEGDGWWLVREAMLDSLRLPRTGMAIAVDIGEPTNIHPRNKQEVGRHLALWALGEVYGRAVAATSGPLPVGYEIRGSHVLVSFTHANGLAAKNAGAVRGFELAGADGRWRPASAAIDGGTVIVSSPDVKEPVAVRYAWAANPDGHLVNAAGLPASPFRFGADKFPNLGNPAR